MLSVGCLVLSVGVVRATYLCREVFGDGALVGGVSGEVANGISVPRVFRIHPALALPLLTHNLQKTRGKR